MKHSAKSPNEWDVFDAPNELGQPAKVRYPRVLPCGDNALTIELGDRIDPLIHDRIVALLNVLKAVDLPIVGLTPSYRSIMIEYDAIAVDYKQLTMRLRTICQSIVPCTDNGRHWEIPVVYGGQFGVDLQSYAQRKGLSEAEVVRLHSACVYRVYMIGFTPGFAYLGGLNPALAAPRLASPRRDVAPGAISIGGAQSAISGVAAPSGWHQIGRTPVWTYRPDASEPCLLAPSDRVSFVPIAEAEWSSLALAAYKGEIVARRRA